MVEVGSEVEELYFGAAVRSGSRTLTLLSPRAGGPEQVVRYDVLLAHARGAAAALEASGSVRAGEPLLVVAATGLDEVATLLGAMLLGALPVPISPPLGLVGLEGWVARITRTAVALGCTAVAGSAASLELLATHGVGVAGAAGAPGAPPGASLPAIDAGRRPADGPARPGRSRRGDAYVQLTSGSTAEPKGVLIGHDNVAANIDMIGRASGVTPADRVCSWLPLFHDMGLVGTLLFALRLDLDLVLLPPQAFLMRPARWLEAISTHRCTLSPAPAFAFPYVAHRVKEADLQGLDLRSWRIAYCGAEPIHAPGVARFVERLAPRGLSAGTPFPCYGLAEATLAVTFGPPGRGVVEAPLSRRGLAEGRAAPPLGPDDRLELVKNGRPLDELAVEVRDDQGRALEAGRVGGVFVRGTSVARGYFRNPAATAAAFGADGWLDTGDAGALVDGELVIVGRRKDLIIVRGRNHAPVDLEWAAQSVAGVRPGSAVAFAIADAEEGTEVPVLACEVADEESDWSRGAIAAGVQEAALGVAGLRLHEVVLLPPGTVPKTTSGKVQRSKARELYLAGTLRPARD